MSDTTSSARRHPDAPSGGRSASELLEKFKVTEDTFQVTLKDKVVVSFRVIRSADEFYQLREGAARWSSAIMSNPAPAMQQFLPKSRQTLEQCFWVKELAIDPFFNDVEILQLADQCGAALPVLYVQLMSKIGAQLFDFEAQEIDAQGED